MRRAAESIGKCAIGFIAGALVLSTFSALQKLIAGYPIALKGFYVPIVFGGVIGVVLCQWRSALKAKEKNLCEAKKKAEESDQLKTAFLHNLSHEIRTPLNAICGFAELINHSDLQKDKLSDYTSIINTSSHQLLGIVTDVLTISTLETDQEAVSLSPISVNTIIDNLFATYSQKIKGKNIALHIKKQLTDRHSGAHADGPKLQQVLNHLLNNAIKFTHEGRIDFGYEIAEDQLKFFVKDTGIGIEPSMHKIIFDPFRQADDTVHIKYGGTGLGLSICKGFVELMGGRIWVESQPGQGSNFVFTIPYQPVAEQEQTTAPETKDGPHSILIAEDEEYNLYYVREILTEIKLNEGYAHNGPAAVPACQQNSDIKLVLMDIKMPVMDGYTAAKLIKKLRPNLPIIAQSAYAFGQATLEYTDTFDGYLPKPFSAEELEKIVHRFLGKT